MIPWILALVMAGLAAGIGFSVALMKLQDRHMRLLLGISDGINGELDVLQARLAAQSVVDTVAEISTAAPRLKPHHSRRLAVALTHSRGLLPSPTTSFN